MPRRPGESTAIYLGRVLDNLGLNDMADRARLFHYDDYFCPNDIPDAAMNINRLVKELSEHKENADDEDAVHIQEVIELAMDGEFDGTKEESAQWAKSPDGQAAFNELMNRQ